MKDEATFREWHRRAIGQQLQFDRLDREKYWSPAVAVGDREWLSGDVTKRKLKRHRMIEADKAYMRLRVVDQLSVTGDRCSAPCRDPVSI